MFVHTYTNKYGHIKKKKKTSSLSTRNDCAVQYGI